MSKKKCVKESFLFSRLSVSPISFVSHNILRELSKSTSLFYSTSFWKNWWST